MGKAKRRVRQCRINALRRRTPLRDRLEAKRFAFSIIVTGSETTKAIDLFLWNDISLPFTKSELYNEMKVVCDAIIKFGNESMMKHFNNIQQNSIISFDGSWEHRRNSNRCLTTVIDQSTQKVVMACIKSSKVSINSPDYCKVPQNMEVESIKTMIPYLRQNKNIIGYVHDNDAKTRKALFTENWHIFEYLDPGHSMKSFDRKLQKYNSMHQNIFREIEVKLRKFMKMLLKSSENIFQKVTWWINSVAHFCGDHSKCPFAHKPTQIWSLSKNSEAIRILIQFLHDTKFIIEKCTPLYSTQSNEAFHRIKLKYATKDVKWGFTWEARMYAAILDRNETFWKMDLFNFLGLRPINISNRLFLNKEEKYRIYRKIVRRNENYLRKQNEYRKNISPEIPAQILYKVNPYKQ